MNTPKATGSVTADSRYRSDHITSGDVRNFFMYTANLHSEADGMCYHHLNILRLILLQPLLYIIIHLNFILAINHHTYNFWIPFAHCLATPFNILRLAVALLLLLLESFMWPIRFLLGLVLSPVAMHLTLGSIYALPASVIHNLCRGAGLAVVRTAHVRTPQPIRTFRLNAAHLGPVLCIRARTYEQALIFANTYRLQQRAGTGSECILIRGNYILVSQWTVISLHTIFNFHGPHITMWKLLDLTTFEWRIVILNLHLPTETIIEDTSSSSSSYNQKYSPLEPRMDECPEDAAYRLTNLRHLTIGSIHSLGTPRTTAEIEAIVDSPLGWNKYHLISKTVGSNTIVISRRDRRAASHLLAIFSTALLYISFREPLSTTSHSLAHHLGISINLQALLIANYALVVTLAAENVVGKLQDVVDVKSVRYGIIATRAIDRGFVRGFHVPGGRWLSYWNGGTEGVRHDVFKAEVNAVCNSVVKVDENGVWKVLQIGYAPPVRFETTENMTVEWVEPSIA